MCTRVGNTNQFGGGMWMVYCPFCSAPLSSAGLKYDDTAARGNPPEYNAFIKTRESQLDWLNDVVAVKDDGSTVVRGDYDDYGVVVDGRGVNWPEEVEVDRTGGAKAEGLHHKCWLAMGSPMSLAPNPGRYSHPNLYLSQGLQDRYGITFDLNELHEQFLQTSKLDVDKNAWMLLDPSIPGTKNYERFASMVQWIKKKSLKKKSSLYSQPTASLPAPKSKVKKTTATVAPKPKAKVKKTTATVAPKPKPKAKVKKTTATVPATTVPQGKPCNQSSPKASDPEYVCNPDSGRWVKRSSPTGKKVVQKYNL
jgi:hypothetical protein